MTLPPMARSDKHVRLPQRDGSDRLFDARGGGAKADQDMGSERAESVGSSARGRGLRVAMIQEVPSKYTREGSYHIF